MRELRRGLTGLMAIFAFALHALVMTLPPAAQAGFDPSAVICLNSGLANSHAGTSQPSDTPQVRDCGHCVLCFAATAPDRDTTVTPVAFTTRLASALERLAMAAPLANPSYRPALPRGPPTSM